MVNEIPFTQSVSGACGPATPPAGLDLGQLGGTDQRVGLLQEPSSSALVVICAVMCLCIAVRCAEVVAAPERFKL